MNREVGVGLIPYSSLPQWLVRRMVSADVKHMLRRTPKSEAGNPKATCICHHSKHVIMLTVPTAEGGV